MLTLTWYPDVSPSPNLGFVISQIFSNSVGEQYFSPKSAWVFTATSPSMQVGPAEEGTGVGGGDQARCLTRRQRR